MITHHEITAGLWLLVFASGGVVGRFTAWRYVERKLDSEYEAGKAEGRDEGWNAGYKVGVDDEARGLAYVYDENGEDVVQWCGICDKPGHVSDTHEGVMPDDSERDETRSVEPGPVETVRPAGPSPAAGRTYSELVLLASQGELEAMEALGVPDVDPGWHQRQLLANVEWYRAAREKVEAL